MKISGVLILIIVFSAAAVQAFTGGDGTAGNPYQISTREDLEAVNSKLAAHYILLNDIDLAGITYTQAVIARDTSTSDGFQGTSFTGTFNGNGFAVINLKISASSNEYIGLFGQIGSGGVVSNLGIVDCDISGMFGMYYAGGLCGYNNSGTITTSYTTGTVSGYVYVGGLSGYNYSGTITSSYSTCEVSGGSNDVGGLCGHNRNGTISSSYSTGTVSGSFHVGGLCGVNNYGSITSSHATGAASGENYIGGLCGFNYYSITSSYATGTVTGSGYYVGGLCGRSNYTITSCYATGAVSGSTHVGGLCGYSYFSSITSSYATGAVSGNGAVGGLCGHIYSGTITSTYATGAVSGSYTVGGLCGYNYYGYIFSSFWDMDTSEQPTSSGGGTGLTTSQMQTMSTFTDAGWDFVNEDMNGQMEVWYMPQDDYPRLYWQAAKGDINYDGQISEGDVLILAAQWLTAFQQGQRLTADINQDGIVNLQDYCVIAEFWLVQ